MGLKKYSMLVLAFLLSQVLTITSFAGLYSEIDIVVREAAELQFSAFVDPTSNYDLFQKIKIFESDEQIPGCDFVIKGLAPLPDRTFSFTACVVALNKHQITATIIDYK